MLKSEILDILHSKHKHLTTDDIEQVFNLFTKKLISSLIEGNNIEIRGFGTFSKKINKEKFVRNPKTDEKIFKSKSFKLHFKIGKTLHNRLNNTVINEE
tara:strand:- start:156 stop:452 length:297 start_codon:yes stop_codon:yes gene_type:complete